MRKKGRLRRKFTFTMGLLLCINMILTACPISVQATVDPSDIDAKLYNVDGVSYYTDGLTLYGYMADTWNTIEGQIGVDESAVVSYGWTAEFLAAVDELKKAGGIEVAACSMVDGLVVFGGVYYIDTQMEEGITYTGNVFYITFSEPTTVTVGGNQAKIELTEETETPTVTPNDEPVVENTYGDVDANGEVNASDALLILQACVGLKNLDESQERAADVNGNEGVDVSDALWVLKYSVGLIHDFSEIFALPSDENNAISSALQTVLESYEAQQVTSDSFISWTFDDGFYAYPDDAAGFLSGYILDINDEGVDELISAWSDGTNIYLKLTTCDENLTIQEFDSEIIMTLEYCDTLHLVLYYNEEAEQWTIAATDFVYKSYTTARAVSCKQYVVSDSFDSADEDESTWLTCVKSWEWNNIVYGWEELDEIREELEALHWPTSDDSLLSIDTTASGTVYYLARTECSWSSDDGVTNNGAVYTLRFCTGEELTGE